MSIRQEKFAKQMQRDLGEIISRHSRDWFNGEFITVSGVEVSPDLGFAKIFLSLAMAKDRKAAMENAEVYKREIRHELAGRIRNEVRKIPELVFLEDNSLDYAMKMEDLFNRIHKDENKDPRN